MNEITLVQPSGIECFVLVNLHFTFHPAHFQKFDDIIVDKLKQTQSVGEH